MDIWIITCLEAFSVAFIKSKTAVFVNKLRILIGLFPNLS